MTLPLSEMHTIAQGEVSSLVDFITLHQQKRTRPASWVEQNQRILQHRRQVVLLIEMEMTRRRESRIERKQA
jgi:hypothetical protein